jgi:hypothetical protein
MKLEYLATGSPDCPLLRLYDFTPEEAGQLHATLVALAADEVKRVEVHDLPFIEPLAECRLTLRRHKWDQGIIKMGPTNEFECGLTAGAWDNVAGLVEPFAEHARGWQWLVCTPSETSLLISALGDW